MSAARLSENRHLCGLIRSHREMRPQRREDAGFPFDGGQEVDLRTEDVKKLSRADLETLARGIDGYPLGRAGAAKDEILRRDREYAQKQEQSRLWWPKLGAWAAIVSAVASIIAACEGLLK